MTPQLSIQYQIQNTALNLNNGQFKQPSQNLRTRQVSPSTPILPKNPPKTKLSLLRAILDLKNQRDALHRHQKKLTHLSTTYTLSAKTALTNQNRPLALL